VNGNTQVYFEHVFCGERLLRLLLLEQSGLVVADVQDGRVVFDVILQLDETHEHEFSRHSVDQLVLLLCLPDHQEFVVVDFVALPLENVGVFVHDRDYGVDYCHDFFFEYLQRFLKVSDGDLCKNSIYFAARNQSIDVIVFAYIFDNDVFSSESHP